MPGFRARAGRMRSVGKDDDTHRPGLIGARALETQPRSASRGSIGEFQPASAEHNNRRLKCLKGCRRVAPWPPAGPLGGVRNNTERRRVSLAVRSAAGNSTGPRFGSPPNLGPEALMPRSARSGRGLVLAGSPIAQPSAAGTALGFWGRCSDLSRIDPTIPGGFRRRRPIPPRRFPGRRAACRGLACRYRAGLPARRDRPRPCGGS